MTTNGESHHFLPLDQDELRHRVRGQLQNAASLINLQIRRTRHPEAVRALEDLRARFNTITNIYVDLDETSDAPITIERMLDRFARELVALYDPTSRHTTMIEIAPVVLSGQRAVMLGQIMVELIINAYRHGLGDRASGALSVELRVERDHAVFEVADDGPGLRDREPEEAEFGFALVRNLADALNGTFERQHRDGFVACVRFPLNP